MQDRGWSLGSGAKGEGRAVRGPGQGLGFGGQRASQMCHGSGGSSPDRCVQGVAGTGKQGWWDPGSAMPHGAARLPRSPVLGQLAPTISPKGSDLCWTLVRGSQEGHQPLTTPSLRPPGETRVQGALPGEAWPRPTGRKILQFAACPALVTARKSSKSWVQGSHGVPRAEVSR